MGQQSVHECFLPAQHRFLTAPGYVSDVGRLKLREQVSEEHVHAEAIQAPQLLERVDTATKQGGDIRIGNQQLPHIVTDLRRSFERHQALGLKVQFELPRILPDFVGNLDQGHQHREAADDLGDGGPFLY